MYNSQLTVNEIAQDSYKRLMCVHMSAASRYSTLVYACANLLRVPNKRKNRWRASPLPASDVGPRPAGRASAQTNCPGLQRTKPRVHLGMSRTDRAPSTGGEE